MSDDMPQMDELARLRTQRDVRDGEEILGAPRIDVYCGDASHAPRRFSWPLYRDNTGVWRPISSQHKGLQFHRLNSNALSETGPERWRYEFKCDFCKTTVPARGEKLAPILDTLTAAGEPDISLAGLRPRLRQVR